MPENSTLFGRIGQWFKRNGKSDGDLPLMREIDAPIDANRQLPAPSVFRPWARRDQAISNLQNGFESLADLMNSIRENLEKQGRRQEELLGYLSHLPTAMETLPETARLQAETLKTIHTQLEHQNLQHERLTEILEKVSVAEGDQQEILKSLRDRVETLHQHDQAITDNLHGVGSAMAGVSKNSQISAEILGQLRDNLDSRDGQLERLLQKQATRFTVLLSAAITLSVLALTAAGVIGYFLLIKSR